MLSMNFNHLLFSVTPKALTLVALVGLSAGLVTGCTEPAATPPTASSPLPVPPAAVQATTSASAAASAAPSSAPASAAPASAAPSKAAAAPAATPAAVPTGKSATARVAFAPGATSSVLKGGVVRGERMTYLLGAQKGQTMTLGITSAESNAVFDVVGPGGKLIKSGATGWSGPLPADGDYAIIVGGTRGNATYELTTQVK
jgi:hypothetical protein